MRKKMLYTLTAFLCAAVSLFMFTACGKLSVSDAQPFSEEELFRVIEEAITDNQEQVTYTCSREEGVNEAVDDALDRAFDRYFIGTNVDEITWTVTELFDVTAEIELDLVHDIMDLRSLAADYSETNLEKAVWDAVMNKKPFLRVLFKNDGSVTSDRVDADFKKYLDIEDGAAILFYYVQEFTHSVLEYEDYVLFQVDMVYNEDTVPFKDMINEPDMRKAIEKVIVDWDGDGTAAMYYEEAPDNIEEYLTVLMNTANANDVDDPYLCDWFKFQNAGKKDAFAILDKDYKGYDMQAIEQYKQELLEEACAIAKSVNEGTTEDKIKDIANILTGRIKYDKALMERIKKEETVIHEDNLLRSAYGGIIKGNTVCSGYAKSFKLICDIKGIDCWIICGEVKGEAHEWNAVYIDEKMYYVDLTFADTGGGKKFYMFGEELYKKEGYKEDEEYFIPAA